MATAFYAFQDAYGTSWGGEMTLKEAIKSAHKHAKACRCGVHVERTDDRGFVLEGKGAFYAAVSP